MAKHHYVPQFYIKLFRIPDTRAGVFMYERNKEPTQRNTANIAFKRGFYSYVEKSTGRQTEALEKTFSEIEDKAKPTIDALILDQTKVLTEKEEANLIYFIAHLRTRNTAYRESLKTNYTAAAKSMMKFEATNLSRFRKVVNVLTKGRAKEEDVQRYRKFFLEREYGLDYEDETFLLHQALESAQIAYFVLAKKNMYFFKTTGDSYFITSDNPVNVHFDSGFDAVYGGGGLMGSVVTLPISPSLTLVLTDDKKDQKAVEIESDMVDMLNRMQCHSCLDYMFSDRNLVDIKTKLDNTKRGYGQAVVVEHAGKTSLHVPKQVS